MLALLAALLAFGLLENRRHQRGLEAIPLRIHVNGTRGKSSVTRLIAAGLRAGGRRTIAKTTGTSPMLILEDGRQQRIRRAGRANIIEQVQVVKIAAERGAQALVIECMALLPELQWLSEHRMIRSTVGVLTNAREDHFDVMGPTAAHVARSLCNTVPSRGVLFTADERFLAIFKEAAALNSTEVVLADAADVADEEMHPFGYIEHRENVALALKVCQAQGVSREKALAGMYGCIPDPGVLRLYKVQYFDKQIDFVNAFAANDRESTLLILERLRALLGKDRKVIVLFNTRGDRIQRAEQFAGMIAHDIKADLFILLGEFVDAVEASAVRQGAPADKILNLGPLRREEIPHLFEAVLHATVSRAIVVGIGNIGGIGQAIVDFFENRARGPVSHAR